jgi:hypothetical protein
MFCEEQFSKKLCFKKVLKNGLERLGAVFKKTSIGYLMSIIREG